MLGKMMTALLAAAAFVPTIALAQEAADERDDRALRRAERREARAEAVEQPARAERQADAPRRERSEDRPSRAAAAEVQVRPEVRAERRDRQDRVDTGDRGAMFAERAQRQQARQAEADRRQRDNGQALAGQRQGEWRRDETARNVPAIAGQRRDRNGVNIGQRWNDDRRYDGNARRDDGNRWNNDRRVADDGRRNDNDRWNNGRGYGSPATWNNRNGWNRGWRDNGRYDWGRYRQQNRQAFRLPRYYAPYDWNYGYRRFSIGVTLSSLLWSQDYWLDDPWSYRLPDADGPYRWVRYYNDALLVDVRTGQVVDTVYDIFY